MITPNKVITLDQSVLSKLEFVLREGPEAIDLASFYGRASEQFESIDQFILTLDTLYVLGRIDVDLVTRMLTYAT